MPHETQKQWVKPELKVISFAKTSEHVLMVRPSGWQSQKNPGSDDNPNTPG